MKNFYTLLFALLLAFSTSNVLAQAGPCTLSGASNYIDFTSSSTIMMHVSVNGISQYTYGWNDGTPVGSSSQKPFYSGWCVTITDIMTGCDTTICESCIPTGGIGPCPMIYMPVCGCDGNIYSNDCEAMQNGIFTYTSAIGPNGQLLPCSPPAPSWDCVNGACVDPGTGNGQYTTLNACLLDSCAVMPPSSWDCITGQGCYDPGTGMGMYPSQVACNISCGGVTPSWDCDPLTGCYDPGTGNGQYSTIANCASMCLIIAPSWDCINGACIDPQTGFGQYAIESTCLFLCMPPASSWDCINGACIDPQTGFGQYPTLNDCVFDSCAVMPPTSSWDCIPGQGCYDPGTGLGAYTSLAACNSSCTVTPSWDCIPGQGCYDPLTGTGMYSSQAACNVACGGTPSWDCVNSACIDPGTGNGQYTTLNSCLLDSCNVMPPVLSWDCIPGQGCYDPLTGMGMYSSQAACDNVCIVNAVEEQTTNKKLLKITDLLGRETKGSKNDVLFYIYDDGTVEKRIVIE